jgi:hypothetical protein
MTTIRLIERLWGEALSNDQTFTAKANVGNSDARVNWATRGERHRNASQPESQEKPAALAQICNCLNTRAMTSRSLIRKSPLSRLPRAQRFARPQVQGLYLRPEARRHQGDQIGLAPPLRRRSAVEPLSATLRARTVWAETSSKAPKATPPTCFWPPTAATSACSSSGWQPFGVSSSYLSSRRERPSLNAFDADQ